MSKTKKNFLTWQFVAVYVTIGLILVLFVALVYVYPQTFSARCRLSGIEYVNVFPAKCWNEDIDPRYCPLPSEVDCSVQGDLPTYFVYQLR
jgi:hypothetical protein